MTRIAIIADIHGNLPAWQAVEADLARCAPDRVIVNGDVINRGPQSAECLAAVRATGWPVIFGNHEEYVLKYEDGDLPQEFYTALWLPSRLVWQSLTADDFDYLRTLPHHLVIDEPGLPAIHITHGSPRGLSDGLGPWLTDSELREIAALFPQPIIVGAHTHRPYDHHLGDRWFLNSGAVGVPYNGNPAAQYLLLTAAHGAWQAEFRAVPYDRQPLYDAWARTGQLEHSSIARLFKYEIETATYHLAHYLHYCEQLGLPQDSIESFERYRAATQPAAPCPYSKPS